MSKEKFRTVVKGIITNSGEILIGKKEKTEGHPISEEWHLLGGHLENGEQVEEAIKREVKEETGLEVNVHQTVDVMTFAWDGEEKDSLQIVFHCEAENRENAEPKDDLTELKWVGPEKVKDYVHSGEAQRLRDRDEQAQFLEKMKKAPF
jgi:8-oxo-dGTP diphosphatase